MRRCCGSRFPTGSCRPRQLRTLAHIARTYDRGYGHFTTRQNIQFNWPQLEQRARHPGRARARWRCTRSRPPATASATSRATTSPAWPATRSSIRGRTAELIRQWSTFHPEFAYLPRKFKIAVTGATNDRAAILVHDIGLQLVRRTTRGEIGFRVAVGGGLGRTPIDRPRDPRVPAARRDPQLPRRDPARLQPLRPPRQQVQGAHQDPGEGAHAGGVHARRRGRVGAAARRPGDRARRGVRAPRRHSSCRRAYEQLAGRRRRRSAPRWPTTARSPTGRSATCIRTRCRATRSSRCRSRRPACRRAT